MTEAPQVKVPAKPRVLTPPPDLQSLVAKHGGYDLITPEAWAEYDATLADWRERLRLNKLEKEGA
jgi:hypothetical protein